MSGIKGAFFDFDGVITIEKQGSPAIISYISNELGIPYDRVEKAYCKHNKDLLLGNITHRDMWDELCSDVGQVINYRVLEDAFMNVTIDGKMIDYIKALRKDHLIGMITDNKADRIKALVDKPELKGLFDVVIISAEVHGRKSEKKIFEEALRQSGLKPSECVFIDNTASNLERPSEMGFNTVFFDDENRDYSELDRLIGRSDI